MKKVDLHIHTNHSDGAFSPKDILKMCEETGLEIIAIADHDSTKAYHDIKDKKLSFNGKIIPAVELSFKKDGRVYDVLGYMININIIDEWLQEKYTHAKLLSNQQAILYDMQNLYTRLGIKYESDLKITSGKKSEAYNLVKHSALKFKENITTAPELFGEMFYKRHHTNPKSRFFVDETKNMPTLQECLKVIKNAGGISVLAHSGAYGFTEEEMKSFILYAINCGIDGLELKYNCHTPQDEALISDLAQKHNLILTGGSDFHGGKVKPNVKLGKIYNNKNIYEEDIQTFLNEIKNINALEVF